jgi:Fic family protein
MKKSLLETNPYLSDPAMRKKMLRRSIISSSAIEGIYITEEDLDRVEKKDAEKDVLEESSNTPR